MELFDSHSHYNDEKFNEDREKIIKETYEAGVTKFVCAGYNINSSLFSLEMSKKYEFIYSICGISPNDIPQSEQQLWKDIAEISKIVKDNKSKKLVAIGEIGLDIIRNNKVEKSGIFHCCQLNQELVRQALELGYYISFAGPITFKNSKNAPEIIKMVPMDRILIETDSPYLSPEPNRGKRNDCRNVKYVAQKIADVKEITVEEVAQKTYGNAIRIFNI